MKVTLIFLALFVSLTASANGFSLTRNGKQVHCAHRHLEGHRIVDSFACLAAIDVVKEGLAVQIDEIYQQKDDQVLSAEDAIDQIMVRSNQVLRAREFEIDVINGKKECFCTKNLVKKGFGAPLLINSFE